MQENAHLNDLFGKYSRGDLSKKDLEGHIFQHILDNHQRFRLAHWTRDQCGDFLGWLYPRLSRAIGFYQDQGASFTAYIGSIIHWASREYTKRQMEHRVTEYTCWTAKAEDLAVHDSEPEYGAGAAKTTGDARREIAEPERPGEAQKPFPRVSNPRQVLMLLLKSYYFVSDDLLLRIAPAIGVGADQLRQFVGELRVRRIKREMEIRGLQERCYNQYYRCLSFEKKLRSLPEDSALHEKLNARLIRARDRLDRMKKRLAKLRVGASNRQIAEVLGVPKGTVDSNLYALRSKLREMGA